jgi:hypothetical protein
MFRLTYGHHFFSHERQMNAVAEFGHEQPIPNLQGIEHGLGRDDIGLDDEKSDKQRYEQSCNQNLDQFNE